MRKIRHPTAYLSLIHICWHKQWQGNPPETLVPVGTVYLGRLINIRGDIGQSGL